MNFKAAAREVLKEIGHPLHYSDITEIALESGYLRSAGRTPQNTMRARLSVDVRDNPESPSSSLLLASTASKIHFERPEDTVYCTFGGSKLIEERLWLR